MTLFLILALLIVVVAAITGGGMFAGRRTRVIDRTYAADPVDEVVEVVDEPVTARRVRRRRVIR
jgi:hypothetical protein